MFVRVATFMIVSGTGEMLRQRYLTECAPLVMAAEGSVDCLVLEPVDEQAPVAVCTVWRSEAAAAAYEASGTAADVAGRVREFFAGPPELRSYEVHRP